MRCHFKIKNVLFLLPLLQVAHAAILPSVQNKQELDRLERQSNQYLIEEAKRTEALLQQQRAIRGEDAETGLPANSSWKFNVTRIEILDDHLFDGSPQREEIVQRYLGKDLGKSDIFTLVKELTDFYISRGYATTLISIDPGNIKSGTLKEGANKYPPQRK
ncbi:POTRA domain-containing protein [Enterobacter kobei]|uniref:POTRA domain-containing protein n=1 Tax=Enterobacter kobei TaxID=208224 RepID=UPI003B8A406C